MKILISKIAKETEKAMMISAVVYFGSNMHFKDIWFPKSVIASVGEKTVDVADWFVKKQEIANTFHGYRMSFEYMN